MHGGGNFGTDQKMNVNDFDPDKEMAQNLEKSLFFTIFFPLKWLFFYIDPVIFKGFFKTLEMKDIPQISSGKKVEATTKKFDWWWKKFSFMKKGKLTATLLCTFFFDFWIISFGAYIIYAGLQVAVPVLMREFFKQLTPKITDEYEQMIDLGQAMLPSNMLSDSTVSEIKSMFRTNDYEVWIYLGLYLLAFIGSFCFRIWGMHVSTTVGMKVRAILTNKMYEKSLKLDGKARAKFDNGKIINYISTDTIKIERVFAFVLMGASSVVTLVGAIVFLFYYIGLEPTLATLCTPFVIVPFLIFFMICMISIRKKIMKITDRRVKKTNEFLTGIKIIKFFTWEEKLLNVIQIIRNKEIRWSVILMFFFSAMITMFVSLPVLMSSVAFIVLYFKEGILDPITVNIALLFLNLLQTPIAILPMMSIALLECFISLGRIESLLEASELPVIPEGKNFDTPVFVKSGNFQWDSIKASKDSRKEDLPPPKSIKEFIKRKKLEKKRKKEQKLNEMKEIPFSLSEINLEIKKGELIMICGSVGCGKSSLFAALLGEMGMKNIEGQEKGIVEVSGNVAYCPQNPWILNNTLLENILMGKQLDESKYDRIVDCCCLKKDIEILKGGRMIEIGSKGINLSGGQKARVSVARAVYQDADIYLLDDPLSAVDAHVGKKLFENCICGELKHKTRILITHQIHVLEKGDRILYLEDGKIKEHGKFDDLMSKKQGFYELISKNLATEEEKKEEKEEKDEEIEENNEKKDENIEKSLKNRKKNTKIEKLIEKEDKQKGRIKFSVFNNYIKAGGGWIFVFGLFIFFVFAQCITTGQSYWLTEWMSRTFNVKESNVFITSVYMNGTMGFNSTLNSTVFVPLSTLTYYDKDLGCPNFTSSGIITVCQEYPINIIWDSNYGNGTIIQEGLTDIHSLLIYAGFGGGSVVVSFFKDLALALFCLLAARKLHKLAINRVARSPSSFFDITPVGRILNRFSIDFETLDFRIIRVMSSLFSMILSVCGSFALMIYTTNGIFAPFLIPIGIIYVFVYIYFRKSIIEIKRLNSISKSPLLANVQESLNGMDSIRAYKKTESFIKENKKRIDINNATHYCMISAQRWLALRLSFVSVLVIICISVICVLLTYYAPDSWQLDLAYITTGVSYSLSISYLLSYLFNQLSESEVYANSIERVDHYCTKLKQEAPRHLKTDQELIKDKWPQNGEIEFEEFYCKYRPNLPFVMKDVSFTVKSGEKIGVCGRTGSGKSTTMLAIFRFIDPLHGRILIDGIDINNIGTKLLRSSISIIPQDPILFSGSIRDNIDPFQKCTNDEIWEALNNVGSGLKNTIIKAGGLNGVVQEGGENFSQGERQLLCFVRATVKKSKILILDECTSSVDVTTDKLIQEAIRNQKSTTILTIAHRLNTIIDYDRILVLEKGKVAEFDTPKNLLSLPKYHIFKDLVNETGKANSRFLKAIVFGEEYEKEVQFLGKETIIDINVNNNGEAAEYKEEKEKKEEIFYRVNFDYQKNNDDELSLKKDEKILFIDQPEKNWIKGKKVETGEIGLFPSNFTTKI